MLKRDRMLKFKLPGWLSLVRSKACLRLLFIVFALALSGCGPPRIRASPGWPRSLGLYMPKRRATRRHYANRSDDRRSARGESQPPDHTFNRRECSCGKGRHPPRW
jgi:hypothetical protein